MDRKAVAREIRDAIFDRAEQDGRVMHGDAMDQIIEGVLAKYDAPEKPRSRMMFVKIGDGGAIEPATLA